MKVVCLRTGNAYGPEYVARLYSGLARNSTRPFNFECIGHSKFPGWWGKLGIFPPRERTIFLDLDTIITGNVDFLFDYDGEFAILRDFWRKNGYGSAVMSIAPGFGGEIYRRFIEEPDATMRRFHGDQEFIETVIKGADLWQDMFPGKIKSYKADYLEHAGPQGASVICFHGVPKPHNVEHVGWISEAWR